MHFSLMSSSILVHALVPIISMTLDWIFVFILWRWMGESSWNKAFFIYNRNLILHVFMSGKEFSFYVSIADAELIAVWNGFRWFTSLMCHFISYISHGRVLILLLHVLSNWFDFTHCCKHVVTCFKKQCSTQSYSFV